MIRAAHRQRKFAKATQKWVLKTWTFCAHAICIAVLAIAVTAPASAEDLPWKQNGGSAAPVYVPNPYDGGYGGTRQQQNRAPYGGQSNAPKPLYPPHAQQGQYQNNTPARGDGYLPPERQRTNRTIRQAPPQAPPKAPYGQQAPRNYGSNYGGTPHRQGQRRRPYQDGNSYQDPSQDPIPGQENYGNRQQPYNPPYQNKNRYIPPQNAYGTDGGYGQVAPYPSDAGQTAPVQSMPPPVQSMPHDETYSSNEVVNAGHKFFGTLSGGIAKAIESVFSKNGRPNAYILGEEAGGSFAVGLRYGEGTVYTKWGGEQKIFWQGPSIGYDFGAAGAKAMILVYNLKDLKQLHARFGALDGQAYLIGGIGITFENRNKVLLARIQTGIGLRLGANIGYIKYSARPTLNPF